MSTVTEIRQELGLDGKQASKSDLKDREATKMMLRRLVNTHLQLLPKGAT